MGIHILLQHSNRQHLHQLRQHIKPLPKQQSTTTPSTRLTTAARVWVTRSRRRSRLRRASPQPTRSRRVSLTPPTRLRRPSAWVATSKRSTTSAAPTRHDRQSIPLSINNPCDTILHSGCRLSFLTYGFGI